MPEILETIPVTMFHRFIVYVLSDCNGEIVYIGRSSRGIHRIAQHREANWWPDVSTAKVYKLKTKSESVRLERKLIRQFSPRMNKQYVPSETVGIKNKRLRIGNDHLLVRTRPDIKRDWKRAAAKRRMKLSEWVRLILDEALAASNGSSK